MPEHVVVKPEKIASAAAVALEESLVVPALFRREGVDQFRGAKDDTINVVVEGVLPWHDFGWRSDRDKVVFDTYAERKIAVTFGGIKYSGVKLTDEQKDFDLLDWAKLMSKQAEAVGRGLEAASVQFLKDHKFDVNMVGTSTDLRGTLVAVRKVMNRLHVPAGRRTLLIGTDWEAALLNDPSITFASSSGDAEAASVLHDASLGRLFGFEVVVSQEIDPDAAYAMVDSAFVFITGAPYVPDSIPFGATASYNGIALRWLRHYNHEQFQDESVVSTYYGFRAVPDILRATDGTNQALITDNEHFVRAVKITLDGGTASFSETAAKATELKKISGLKEADLTVKAKTTTTP